MKIWLLGLLLLGCESGTGGRAIELRFVLATSSPTFTTGTGWVVTLEEARLAVSAVYLYENPPASAARPRRPLDRLADWLVPSAHAHPGDQHFHGGEVRGELLSEILIDAAVAPASSPELPGIAGRVQSFSLRLDPPSAAGAAALHGHQAWVVGRAEKGGVRIDFEGGLAIGEEGTLRAIDGLGTDLFLDDGVVVRVEANLAGWFDGAHFDRLTEQADSGRFVITPASQPGIAWFIGARDARSFTATAVAP